MYKRKEQRQKFARSGEKMSAACEYKSKAIYGSDGKARNYVCSQIATDEVIRRSQLYLDLIAGKVKLTKKDKKDLITLTLQNFDNFVNRGFIDYRKSVADADDYAAIEWEGKGSILRDILGRKFIDCLGGFGIYNTGIKHPKVVKAVRDQLRRMPLSSQELLDPLRGALGEMLGEISPGDLQCCFFINNGTDAVEGAMKLARMYTKKSGFISTIGGFHGKSMGSLSLLGKASYRKPFEPLLDHVHFVPFGNAKALEEELKKLTLLGQEIAAFIAEPVQGEGGVIVPPDDYFPRVRQLCDKYGILLILDEVQTGFGRTGKMFACEHWNVIPDIMCVAKSLGGGVMPISAFISNKKIWKVLEKNPFIHSTTFGGNPLACAAGLAAINVILSEKLSEKAAERGTYFMRGLGAIQKKYPGFLTAVRGKGLLIGLDFVDEECGYRVAAGLFKRGVLVAGTLLGVKTIRIEPALNIPYTLIDEVLKKLDETLKELTIKPHTV